ncbi:MAG: terminase, partial [Muribaculaceae bacterium]
MNNNIFPSPIHLDISSSSLAGPEVPSVEEMLAENERRRARLLVPYDPIRGDAADPLRVPFRIPGLDCGEVWVPREMLVDPFAVSLMRTGSVDAFIRTEHHTEPSDLLREEVCRRFIRLRIRHDFAFWAASFVYIKTKGGGPDSLFVLNYPQRRLVAMLESMRREGKPIRLVLLKARQWGGSTCVQIYMGWLQLVHSVGLNSLIIAHQGIATDEIKGMFDRMLAKYPDWLLTDADGEQVKGKRLEGAGYTKGTYRVRARDCKVKLGSAERPDSARGGDYNLVHCSEVGLWKKTPQKTPEQIIRAACSGILLAPMTMIVLESTANGTGNYFYNEYQAASKGESQFQPLFVPWFEIENNVIPLADPQKFAASLIEGREAALTVSDRRQPGAYLWWLWQKGATLEAINWYAQERLKYADHGEMASEYPSDDVEAFVHSGARVFDKYKVEALRKDCFPAPLRGEIEGYRPSGPESLKGLHFVPDASGGLQIWEDRVLPCPGNLFKDRYLTVVDIGGRSMKSDWSVIVVFDRNGMGRGRKPRVVAQWRGHTDIDLLAWNAARIAAYYCKSLLVIESNTLETHDLDRSTEGDQSLFILNQIADVYPNLYARRSSEDNILRGVPVKYGFHTNSATKPMVISQLIKSIREGEYVERDEECLEEYLAYERRQNGSYGAIQGHHDDLLMTRAIGLHICFTEMPLPRTRAGQ